MRSKFWTYLFVLFVVSFIMPFFHLGDNLVPLDYYMLVIVNIFAFFAITSIALFMKGRQEKIYLTIVFLLSIAPNCLVFAYLLLTGTYMYNDQYWVIFASNASESREYISEFVSLPLVLGVLAYIVVGGFLLFKSGSSLSLQRKEHRLWYGFSILIILLIISLQYLSTTMCIIDFYKSGVRYFWESHKMQKEAAMRKAHPIPVDCVLSDSTNHTFVVVLGESLTRSHMDIYGYFRPTTPHLESMRDELLIYRDVVSPSTHTIGVMKYLLTFAHHDHPEYYFDKPSIVDIFNYAGFETYWISNQEIISKWGGNYGIIAQGADHLVDLSIVRQPDEIVLASLDQALKKKTERKKIIFIHTMGNHHSYVCRYPNSYEHFDFGKDPLQEKSYYNDFMRKTIDEYDNSILYTDYVVSSIIERVKAENESSFVLFLSDHGEEVNDFRPFCGHSSSSSFQCEVPLILWRSEQYQKEMGSLDIDSLRPFSTEHLIHSLSTLAGLRYDDYIPEFSLFDSTFVPQRRMVAEIEYQEVVRRTQEQMQN